ncbi:OLC1v1022956C1 [Oldenlandia corymbosa var. corymbosa]|uniref:OLC1v1022956C1 n=1 Tax=Oldenlandia corymbosa var. corymbosa TaxID=529605 RepID=A0AAV1C1M9_OLDCO|nr:OLC1v1022956C1 [Oldenlandia corymbosa var. corymbosa]
MGKWDDLQSSVSRLFNRQASRKPPPGDGTSGSKVVEAVRSNGAQKSDEYFPDPHRRERIGRVLTNLGKFAVDSAVDESLKSVTGGIKVYSIGKSLKDQPYSQPSDGIKKQDLMIAMEEMQAKMEKMQEDVDKLKQQNETCADYSLGLEPLKEFPDEPSESPISPKTNKKKVFIRSRL